MPTEVSTVSIVLERVRVIQYSENQEVRWTESWSVSQGDHSSQCGTHAEVEARGGDETGWREGRGRGKKEGYCSSGNAARAPELEGCSVHKQVTHCGQCCLQQLRTEHLVQGDRKRVYPIANHTASTVTLLLPLRTAW